MWRNGRRGTRQPGEDRTRWPQAAAAVREEGMTHVIGRSYRQGGIEDPTYA